MSSDKDTNTKKFREQFIPIRKEDLIELICNDGKLDEKQQKQFRNFCEILENIYHKDFNSKIKELKRYYYPLNPDLDVVKLKIMTEEEIDKSAKFFMEKLEEVLIKANYEKVSQEELNLALKTKSLFNVSLIVDFEDFDEYTIYKRGESTKEVEIKKLFGLMKKKIKVDMYDRVVIFLRFKDEDYFVDKALGKYDISSGKKVIDFLTKIGRFFKTKKREKILKKLGVEASSTMLKIFKNIPKADIEMLFPNTRVWMNPKDIALIGVPGLIGFISAFVTKFITSIGTIIAVIFVFLATENWDQTELMSLLQTAVRGFAAIGAFGGYIIRQWSKFKNKKINFMKELSENLYFRNLDTNMGVFTNLIDSAEEQELKEAILSYYFLLLEKNYLSEKDLDSIVEKWLYSKINLDIDFEVDDALQKLHKVGLTEKNENDCYTVISIEESLKKLDYLWDNYFNF